MVEMKCTITGREKMKRKEENAVQHDRKKLNSFESEELVTRLIVI